MNIPELKGITTSPNLKPIIVSVDSCFDLVGSRQHGVTAKTKTTGLWTDYLLNARGDDLRRNSNPNLCGLVNVTCKTCDPEH